jgi:hypothetical protein
METLAGVIVVGIVTVWGSVTVTVPHGDVVRPETMPVLAAVMEYTGPEQAGTCASAPTVKCTAKLAVALVTVGETPSETFVARAGTIRTPALVAARSMK